MALQPLLKITSFSGSTNDFDEFESLLQAAILVGNVGDDAQASFLKLNLSGGALLFYSSLPNDTPTNLAAALTALRNRYNQAANQDFHRICFNDRKFDSTKETPEDFIVDLQRLALRAFPDIAAVGGPMLLIVLMKRRVESRRLSFRACLQTQTVERRPCS